MDANVREELNILAKAISDLQRSVEKDFKMHRDAINKLSKKNLMLSKEIKAARDKIRTLQSEISSLKAIIRRA